MLLYQEILSVIRILDEAVDQTVNNKTNNSVNNSVNNFVVNQFTTQISSQNNSSLQNNQSIILSVKDIFSPLIWALKVLTLDKPADVKKYLLPSSVIYNYDKNYDKNNDKNNEKTRMEKENGNEMENKNKNASDNDNINNSNCGDNKNRNKNENENEDENCEESKGLLSEMKIRNIMGRRVDFSKEAVMKVKINIK